MTGPRPDDPRATGRACLRRTLFLATAAALALACGAGSDAGPDAPQAPGTADTGAPGGPVDGVAAAPSGAGDPASGGAARSGKAGALPDDALRVERAVIVDATGFERPLASATLFVPHGWTTEGGVLWGQDAACTNGYVTKWRATSPDGLSRIAILPQERWVANNFGAPASASGCPQASITSVQQYLQGLVARVFTGAEITAIRPREDLRQTLAGMEATRAIPGGQSRTWVEAADASVRFTHDGRPMVGVITTAAIFDVTVADYGTGRMETLAGWTLPSWAATGPADSFDPALAEALRRSIVPDPEWNRRIAGHNAVIAQGRLETSKKIHDINMRTNEEIAAIRNNAWEAAQESSDRRASAFIDTIREVQTYQDPDAPGGQVQLSSHYSEAWKLNDGTYILTNDKSFEPWRDLDMEGQRLSP